MEMERDALRTLARYARRVMNLGMWRREHRWAETTLDLVDGGVLTGALTKTRAVPMTKCLQYTALTLVGGENFCDV